MAMRLPGLGGLVHGPADVSPRLEAPPLECQRAPHLPPGLDQVQVGRLLRLEDECPPGVRSGEQQAIGGARGTQIIHDGIEAFSVRGHPRLPLREAVHIIRRGASLIGRGQRCAVRRLEGAADVPLAAAPRVNLLERPPCRTSCRARGQGRPRHLARVGYGGWGGWLQQGRGDRLLDRYPLPPRQALRACGAHVSEAHDATARRGRGRERRDDPLVSAKAGSTRSPTQVAGVCQRHPSRSHSSSIRERLIGRPLTSWREAASRSSVQLATGSPRSWGLVRRVAMTSLTGAGGQVAGRPDRAFSSSPARPERLKPLRQLRTVAGHRPSAWAMAATGRPWEASQMLRARSTGRAGAVRECASCRSASSALALIKRTRQAMGHLLWQMPQMIPTI